MTTLVTMPEIARLAGVKRQAVTNWRSRTGSVAFPAVVDRSHGVERFARDEVLDWLEATGRGLNPEARLDAPALVAPSDLDVDAAVALVAVRAHAGEDLAPLSVEQRMGYAAMADPSDQYLQAEAFDAASDETLAGFVDGLFEASFGPADALRRLDLARPAADGRGFSAELASITRAIAQACRTQLGPDNVTIDLRLGFPHLVGTGFDSVWAGEGATRSVVTRLALEGADPVTQSPALVRVVSTVGLDLEAALDAVDKEALDLDANQAMIIIGPAAALCDRLTGQAYEMRRGTLELGTLAAAVKLPRGLWLHAHRHSLGLWVLLGGRTAQMAMVTDLSSVDVDPTDLADDVLGALAQTPDRAYRYGRRVPYAGVWTKDTVVPQGIRSVSPAPQNGSAHDRVVEASLVTGKPLTGFDLPVSRGAASVTSAPRTLGALVDAKAIRLIRGTRFSADHLNEAGTIPVLSAGSPTRRIDPLTAESRYGHATRTEPGDVIFTASPRPEAVVDTDGGSRVAYPSRILRATPKADIGPHALAAVINTDATGTDWRVWPIPHIAAEQVPILEATLATAAEHLAELQRRHDMLSGALTDLIHGVTEGSVTLLPHPTRKAG